MLHVHELERGLRGPDGTFQWSTFSQEITGDVPRMFRKDSVEIVDRFFRVPEKMVSWHQHYQIYDFLLQDPACKDGYENRNCDIPNHSNILMKLRRKLQKYVSFRELLTMCVSLYDVSQKDQTRLQYGYLKVNQLTPIGVCTSCVFYFNKLKVFNVCIF